MLTKILAALALAIKKSVAGADVYEICQETDKFIEEELAKTCKNKKNKDLERGVAFPCCLSINEVAGHFSPCKEDSVALKDGDLVSIDLGAHLDGYGALAAHTLIVGGASKGKQADCVLAAHNAFKACCNLMQPGTKNGAITEIIEKVMK